MPDPSKFCRQLAAAIESYLTAYPGAADSEKGIADWWVRQMGLEASVDEVREALELLIEQGKVEMQVMVDGQRHYRARRSGPEPSSR